MNVIIGTETIWICRHFRHEQNWELENQGRINGFRNVSGDGQHTIFKFIEFPLCVHWMIELVKFMKFKFHDGTFTIWLRNKNLRNLFKTIRVADFSALMSWRMIVLKVYFDCSKKPLHYIFYLLFSLCLFLSFILLVFDFRSHSMWRSFWTEFIENIFLFNLVLTSSNSSGSSSRSRKCCDLNEFWLSETRTRILNSKLDAKHTKTDTIQIISIDDYFKRNSLQKQFNTTYYD